jgi:hypothetical protein
MKRILLFVLLAICLLQIQSQNWCPAGATWHYKIKGSIAGIDGLVEFKYTNDEVINNINCKHITGTFKGWKLGASYLNNNTLIPNVKSYTTYESNKVVYLYNGTSFDTVVNFNAAIGDKWLELKYPNGLGCKNTRSNYIVTDTGRIMINNFNLKKVTTSCTHVVTTGTTVNTYSSTNVFVERLLLQGSILNNYGDLFRFYCDRSEITDAPVFNFICYEDNTFPLYNMSGTSCDNLTGIDGNSVMESFIKLYPNPVVDYLVIEQSRKMEELEVSLKDVLGKELKRTQIKDKTELDLRVLNKGIYFIELWQAEKLIGTNKIIKE